MAKKDKKTDSKQTTGQPEQISQAPGMPMFIHAQYIKDLSFENPNAPETLRPGQPSPQMDLNINMDAHKIEDDQIENLYEVILTLSATAKQENKTVFIAEIVYGAVASLQGVPEERHHPMLLIEVPKIMFPFARQTLGDVTQAGGYPPLLINPVDFHSMYRQQFGLDEDEALKNAPKKDVKKAKA